MHFFSVYSLVTIQVILQIKLVIRQNVPSSDLLRDSVRAIKEFARKFQKRHLFVFIHSILIVNR